MTPHFYVNASCPVRKAGEKGRNMTIVRVDNRSSLQIKSTGPANHAIHSMTTQDIVDVPSSLV